MYDVMKHISENSWAKKHMTGHLDSPKVIPSCKQSKGGDLMSSDKGVMLKGLVLVWWTERQPSGCA
jgi:hypothetical protein